MTSGKLPRATLEQKIQILDFYHQSNRPQSETVERYRNEISISTSSFSEWLKHEDDLRRRLNEAGTAFTKNSRRKVKFKYEKINHAMDLLVKQKLDRCEPINEPILREYWSIYAHQFGVDDPKRLVGFSHGWLSQFKKRHGLNKKKMKGNIESYTLSNSDPNTLTPITGSGSSTGNNEVYDPNFTGDTSNNSSSNNNGDSTGSIDSNSPNTNGNNDTNAFSNVSPVQSSTYDLMNPQTTTSTHGNQFRPQQGLNFSNGPSNLNFSNYEIYQNPSSQTRQQAQTYDSRSQKDNIILNSNQNSYDYQQQLRAHYEKRKQHYDQSQNQQQQAQQQQAQQQQAQQHKNQQQSQQRQSLQSSQSQQQGQSQQQPRIQQNVQVTQQLSQQSKQRLHQQSQINSSQPSSQHLQQTQTQTQHLQQASQHQQQNHRLTRSNTRNNVRRPLNTPASTISTVQDVSNGPNIGASDIERFIYMFADRFFHDHRYEYPQTVKIFQEFKNSFFNERIINIRSIQQHQILQQAEKDQQIDIQPRNDQSVHELHQNTPQQPINGIDDFFLRAAVSSNHEENSNRPDNSINGTVGRTPPVNAVLANNVDVNSSNNK